MATPPVAPVSFGHPSPRPIRTALLALAGVVIVALFGAVVRQSWQNNAAELELVKLEQNGAVYLHPMTYLLGELVAAQSTAVRGEAVDADDLHKALAAVAAEDARYGTDLRTSQRLADLTAAVGTALSRSEKGRPAFDTYSVLVTLAVDLYRRIGDTSRLVHDPDLDSYYLMDAAIVRLPDAVVYAGRASDLVTLAGDGPLEGEDAIRAAVARFGVSAAAEQINEGLTKSVDSTNRSALGTNIAERLDQFKAAADAFAPPTMLMEFAQSVDAATLAANARKVSAAASPLAHRLLYELQALLEQRASKLRQQWQLTASFSVAAGLVLLAVAWLMMARPRRIRLIEGQATEVVDAGMSPLTNARDLAAAGGSAGPHVGRATPPPARLGTAEPALPPAQSGGRHAVWGSPNAG